MSSNHHTAYVIIMIITTQHLSSYCFILCSWWLYRVWGQFPPNLDLKKRFVFKLLTLFNFNFQQNFESQVCLFLCETNGHSLWSWTESPHPFPIEKLFLTKTRKIQPAVFFLDQSAVSFIFFGVICRNECHMVDGVWEQEHSKKRSIM